MRGFFQKLLYKILPTTRWEVAQYRKDCEQLIHKYEDLLQHISDYMRSNRDLLYTPEHEMFFLEENNPLALNSFSFFSIKSELSDITEDCESLLARGVERLSELQARNTTIKILTAQLKELRKYSDQIETALGEFEDKLLKMEEALAERSLCN